MEQSNSASGRDVLLNTSSETSQDFNLKYFSYSIMPQWYSQHTANYKMGLNRLFKRAATNSMFLGQAVSKPKLVSKPTSCWITNPIMNVLIHGYEKVFSIVFSRNFHNPTSSAPHTDTIYTASPVKESWHSNDPNTAYLKGVHNHLGFPFSFAFFAWGVPWLSTEDDPNLTKKTQCRE